MDREQERTGWIIGGLIVAIFALALGTNVGACQTRERAVRSGCAEWKANPQNGAAVIEWCVCP